MNAERQANGTTVFPPARTAPLNGAARSSAVRPLPPFRGGPPGASLAAEPVARGAALSEARSEPAPSGLIELIDYQRIEQIEHGHGEDGPIEQSAFFAADARMPSEPGTGEAAIVFGLEDFDPGDAPEPLRRMIAATLRTIPDFPTAGIMFRDITPVLADADLLGAIVLHLAQSFAEERVDLVAAVESRGFILGAPLAVQLGAGFVPIRKPGKLPHRTMRVDYDLEYGSDAVEAHIDALLPGHRVLLIDDLLATGGTASAALRLIQQLEGDIVGAAFLIELAGLGGRARLPDVPVVSLLRLAD